LAGGVRERLLASLRGQEPGDAAAIPVVYAIDVGSNSDRLRRSRVRFSDARRMR